MKELPWVQIKMKCFYYYESESFCFAFITNPSEMQKAMGRNQNQ